MSASTSNMSASTSHGQTGRALSFHASCWLVAGGIACGDVSEVGSGSSGGSPGAGGGGSTAGGGTGGEGADNPCPLDQDTPSCDSLEGAFSRPEYSGVELARASDFGENVEFVALGGYAVLLERGDTAGPRRFAAFRIRESGELSPVADFDAELALPDLEARDVVADVWGFPFLAVLACESGACRIWENRERDNVLAPALLPEIPPQVEARRLTLDLDRALCVFGAQLACLSADNTWLLAPPLPPETGTRFETVLAGQEYEPTSVERPTFALTDAGVVLTLSRDRSSWKRQLGEEAEPVHEVFRLYDTVVAGGPHGLWIPRLWEAPQVTCRTEGVRTSVPLDTSSRAYALVSDSGSLLLRRHVAGSDFYRWCESSSSIEAPVIGLSVQTCGIDVILLTLSPDRLFAPLEQPRCALD